MKLPRKLRILWDYFINTRAKPRIQFLEYMVQNLQQELDAHVAGLSYLLDEQTQASFAYQWQYVKEGTATTYDEKWMDKVADEVSKLTQIPAAAWAGMDVLDVGCGNGRWALGLCRLGAKSVTVLDASLYALQHTTKLCKTHGFEIEAIEADVTTMIPDGRFDLVWCFGVAHHTSAPYTVLQYLADLVKPSGYLFTMLYGWPTTWLHRVPVNQYERLRRETAEMSFNQREEYIRPLVSEKDLHGMFDAVSPHLNRLMTWEQIVFLLSSLGFTDMARMRRTKEHRNHYVIAKKGAE